MDQQPQLIELTPEHAAMLHSLVHPYTELEKKGYIMSQLSKESLDRKKRCGQCSKVLPAKALKLPHAPSAMTLAAGDELLSLSELQVSALKGGNIAADSESKYSQQRTDTGPNDQSKQKSPGKNSGCNFHPGRVGRNRQWSCCGRHPMSQPCRREEKHVELVYAKGELEANWHFEHTPSRRPGDKAAQVAVAVDCEMGTAASGECELIRVSMVDYFSGTVLLDSLVWPDVQMAHFNTRFSGVTRQAMNEARRNRTCLFGRRGARQAIWNYVGPDTVVIGHSLNSDLTSLRWIHYRVADTLLIEDPFARAERARLEKLREAHAAAVLASGENEQTEMPIPQSQHPGCSLKALAKAYLEREIQLRGRGHDSLEDATATRDLLHWHIANRMPKPEASLVEHRW